MRESQPQAPAAQNLSPAEQRFAAALQHHRAGQLREADLLYCQVLTVDPRHADSLHLRGEIASQTGRHALAVDLIGQAIAIAPAIAHYHANLGNVLLALGRLEAALACYRTAIGLDPAFVQARNGLGRALQQQGNPEAAADCYRAVLELQPGDADAHIGLGIANYDQGRLDAAAGCYRRALALKPESQEAHNNLGTVLDRQGQPEAAAACYRRALEIDPEFAEALLNLGAVLGELDRLDAAVACYRQALALHPDRAETQQKLGETHLRLAQLAEAEQCFEAALRLQPDYPEAHNNLAVIQLFLGRPAKAIGSARAAIELRPDFAAAHNNLALALLTTGDLAAGWAEYEWRWQTDTWRESRRAFGRPQWRGEAAPGRTLLVHTEQGFGDTLQFCRYAPLAQARGLRVIIEAPTVLIRVLRSLAGVDAVVERGKTLPHFDFHCPMLSLPLALGTTLATVPGTTPYLHAEPAAEAAWRTRLATPANTGLRVGLAWAGNPHTTWREGAAVDRRRSISPERLAPLFDVPGVAFYSLQKAAVPAPAWCPLIDHMDEIDDFAGTAALLANLDLVITVDTSVAHLAGALAKPVWLLDRFDHCWRWLAGRQDSPWYPTMRIYRQPEPGNWDAVLARAARDLRRLAGARRQPRTEAEGGLRGQRGDHGKRLRRGRQGGGLSLPNDSAGP